jgi:hypothetical protein
LHGEKKLSVLTPAMARGLEFDVVVVMEPGDFAKKRGVSGQPYTSLTRANRELGVAHRKAWPRGMKAGKKRVAARSSKACEKSVDVP